MEWLGTLLTQELVDAFGERIALSHATTFMALNWFPRSSFSAAPNTIIWNGGCGETRRHGVFSGENYESAELLRPDGRDQVACPGQCFRLGAAWKHALSLHARADSVGDVRGQLLACGFCSRLNAGGFVVGEMDSKSWHE